MEALDEEPLGMVRMSSAERILQLDKSMTHFIEELEGLTRTETGASTALTVRSESTDGSLLPPHDGNTAEGGSSDSVQPEPETDGSLLPPHDGNTAEVGSSDSVQPEPEVDAPASRSSSLESLVTLVFQTDSACLLACIEEKSVRTASPYS